MSFRALRPLPANLPSGMAPARPMPIIVGTPRSGTTLLRFMLDSHPEMAIPPETGFLAIAPQFKGRGNALRSEFFHALTTYPPGVPAWSDFEIPEEAFRMRLNEIPHFTPAEGFRAFYRQYAARFGKSRWGDKTPLYCRNLQTIREVLPEARFVHIIRDGRDVAQSLRKMWFSPGESIEVQAAYWRDCVLAARQAGAGHADYLEIRYESLIHHPESTLRQVCTLIELDFARVMLNYYLRAPERLKEHKERALPDGAALTQQQRLRQQERTTEPPDPACVFAWKSAMSQDERERFGCVAGELLLDLGYEI
ncbi:MAG: hypothetical protein DMF70_09375 [Acidobacteria bacterium]|nr:MAG: hypothetical protein DMF70_09375 [Acidobacteriota bacterium]